MQDDMTSAALLKCTKNIKNYKKERAGVCFNYYTKCTEHAFWETLGKHYKHVNMIRQLALDFANEVEQYAPSLARQIRDQQITVEHTKEKVKRGWQEKAWLGETTKDYQHNNL